MGPVCIYLCVLFSVSSVQSQIVLTQSGPEMKKPGESVRLECEGAGFTVSSTWMNWIRQAPGKGLEWLVSYYDSNNKHYNSAIQDRFTASKEGSKLYLQMVSLRAEDSGVYYCASTVQQNIPLSHKNLSCSSQDTLQGAQENYKCNSSCSQ